jgi:anti-sigma factor RsiW
VTDERPVGEDDLQALVDGRLAPRRLDVVKAFLEANPPVAAQVAQEVEQREALRARLAFKVREPIPSRLRVAHLARRRSPSIFRPGALAAAAASLAIGLGVGGAGGAWWAMGQGPRAAGEVSLAGDAMAAHRIYVGERLHPVEVAADQEAHLVQWLSRRLGKPLAAPDLTPQGYRLMGGRLLPAGGEPAALFMYEDARGGRLTLYARSSSTEERTAFRFETQGEVAAFSWIDRGLSYAVSARAERAQLLAVAEAVYRQAEAASASGPGRL